MIEKEKGNKKPLSRFLDSADNRQRLLRSLHSLVQPFAQTPQERDEIARELLTETALIALAKEEEYNGRVSEKAYLLGYSRNILRRWVERRQTDRLRLIYADSAVSNRDGESITDFWESLQHSASITSGVSFDQHIAGRDWVVTLINNAPAGDQEILLLHLLDGKTDQDLAQHLMITPGAARVRLHRAMGRLKASVKEESRFIVREIKEIVR